MTYHSENHLTSVVSRLRQGDESALAVLFEHYYAVLLHTAVQLIKDREIAKDIVQDVFISLWQHRETLQQGTTLYSYLRTACIHKALNHLRATQRRTNAEQLSARLHPTTGKDYAPDTLTENKELEAVIETTLAALPPQQRTTFLLSRYERMSYRQIAEVFDITPLKVERHIMATLKALRRALTAVYKS